jgi:hypothetical protein
MRKKDYILNEKSQLQMRKSIKKDAKTQRLQTYITEQQYLEFTTIAKELNITQTKIIGFLV